jgi:hypothetical protein
MIRACGLPSANTSRVAVDFSAQPSNFSSSSRSASSRRFRRQRRLAARGRDQGRNCADRTGRRRFAGALGDVGVGQPVDRCVRQRAVDPGLQIKGQQLLNGRGGIRRHGAMSKGMLSM